MTGKPRIIPLEVLQEYEEEKKMFESAGRIDHRQERRKSKAQLERMNKEPALANGPYSQGSYSIDRLVQRALN